MDRLRCKNVLQFGIPLMFLVLILMYITSGIQTSVPVIDMTQTRIFPRTSSSGPKLQKSNSNGTLYKIKSGKSTAFVDENGAITIPPPAVLDTLNINQMEELFFRYIESIQTRCVRMIHLGNEEDGGYHVCESHVDINPGSCLTYSFGIRKDFSFDDSVADTFGCDVYSFDPGDGQEDHKHSDKVTFYSIGIGGSDKTITVDKDQWKIMTFGSIKKMLGHADKNIDIVKIDTEGAEWDSLETMLQTGDIYNVNILIIEFHEWITPGNNPSLKDLRTTAKFARFLNTMRGLYNAGFRIYFFRMWPYCRYRDDLGNTRTACHEVHFLRM